MLMKKTLVLFALIFILNACATQYQSFQQKNPGLYYAKAKSPSTGKGYMVGVPESQLKANEYVVEECNRHYSLSDCVLEFTSNTYVYSPPPIASSNTSSSGNKLFYDPKTGAMLECFHVTATGACSHYKPYSGNYSKNQLFYNPNTGAMVPCAHVTASGSCAHYKSYSGNYSRNQKFYNPKTRSMNRCYHVTATGACAHYGP